MANVLFVCLHNAGRSQMSQALFEQAAAGRHAARSAGTQPAEQVHPVVVEAMRELGTDLSDRTPQLLTDELARWADVVVTMGCGDACPYIPGKRYIDWDLVDPAGRRHRHPRSRSRRGARRAHLMNSISEYFGSGQRSSAMIRSSLSATSRTAPIAGRTVSRMYFACSSPSTCGCDEFARSSSPIAATKLSTSSCVSATSRSTPASLTSARWRSAAGSTSVRAIEAAVSASMFTVVVYCSLATS